VARPQPIPQKLGFVRQKTLSADGREVFDLLNEACPRTVILYRAIGRLRPGIWSIGRWSARAFMRFAMSHGFMSDVRIASNRQVAVHQ